MARTIAAEHKVGRKDYLTLHPNDIVVDPKNNVSRWREYTQKDVVSLAEDIRTNPVGQIHPVLAYKNSEGKAVLVQGFKRVAAINYLNKDLPEDQQFQVKVIVTDIAPEQAAMINLSENIQRQGLSDVDIAYAIQFLQEKQGMDDKAVAKFFAKKDGKPQSIGWVHHHKRVLLADKKVKDLLHAGEIPLTSVLDLLKAPEDKRTAILEGALHDIAEMEREQAEREAADLAAEVAAEAEANTDTDTPADPDTEATGKAKGKGKKGKAAKAKKAAKPIKKSKELADRITKRARAEGHKKARTLPEVKTLLQELVGSNRKVSVGILSEIILQFIGGEYADVDAVSKKVLTL